MAPGARSTGRLGQLTDQDDLGRTRELLHRYAEAGFDDAVVLIEPGGLGKRPSCVPFRRPSSDELRQSSSPWLADWLAAAW